MTNSDSLIRETARNTLEIELQALQGMYDSIDEGFCQCVRLIAESKGRLVVTGVGKSAIVGQKMVATLNSTGSPSLFMHAADAIHGDLGMVQQSDIVLCISKSGETAELKTLLPWLVRRNVPIVAMVGNRHSTLALRSTFVLYTPCKREADPNDLAPTASTIAQMAMGDALAMSLGALRGFGVADFALHHPGGALGKKLLLEVGDIYPLHQKPFVMPHTSIKDVILEITSKRLGLTAVINERNELQGVITDGDIRRMLEKDLYTPRVVAADIMSRSPKTASPGILASEALQRMRQYKISQLLVVEPDTGQYVGVVHLHDIIREGIV